MRQVILASLLLFSILVEAQDTCLLTGFEPRRAKYGFRLCRQYNDNTCCVTGMDADALEKFETLVDLGDSCPYRKRNSVVELNQWFCLACSPDQPKFMINETTVRVCKDFAERLWEDDGKIYDGCGLRVVNNVCGSGFDECGDDVVVPSTTYASVEDFMQAVKPPGMRDPEFTFVVVDPNDLNDGEMCFNSAKTVSMSLFLLFAILFSLIH
eukprot:TRINITY_DN9100_c0_g1_i2.p1 TRINITY_DN9100_c0_g1~~TRINITY_DN9100_c0_g1_i2.p1  ORF type:complete len:233 (-),score=39.20 TRINITY_DN9100_c0_g1_i2:74-706(-)